VDSERSCFLHAIYGKRWDDPAEYDRVFQITDQPLNDVLALIRDALAERDRNTTAAGQKTLAMMAVAAKVKAGIATNPRFFIPTLEVLYDGKEIILRGVTHTPEEHTRVEEEARAIAAGVPVRCELHYRK